MAGLRSGAITAMELFGEAANRHQSAGSSLQAYRVWDDTVGRALASNADEAFRAGRDMGPLQGIPVSVKDLYGLDGFDIFAGSAKSLPAKWRQEGPLIRLLRQQITVMAGKTNMVEFAFGAIGMNHHWPIPRNPWDSKDHRIPGGSSSGAGVSLLEGSAIVALGSDTAGSVRIPASVTGTFGYKPSAGRWPLDGLVPLSPTFDTPGFLARSAEDAAIVFDSIDAAFGDEGKCNRTRPADITKIRIGIADDYFWRDCDAGIAEAARTAISELDKAGALVTSSELPETFEAYDLFRAGGLAASELKHFLKAELPEWMDILDPKVKLRIADCPNFASAEFKAREAKFLALTRKAQTRFHGIDVMVCPTVTETPRKVAELSDLDTYTRANMAILRNTCVVNLLGLCAVTMPVGLDAEGMPIGLQCMARGGNDRQLMAIVLAMESVVGPASKKIGHPKVFARQK